jgi:fatty acid desaturase
MSGSGPQSVETPIATSLNVTLLVVAAGGATTLLWAASHSRSWPGLLASAVAFSYVNNTVFSLLHEATHGILHPSGRVNDWLGRLAAAFFPTAYSLQRAFHLTHHRNNRTELEQFDYLRPQDNRLLKLAQWYAIVTGLYWMFPPIACVVYGVAPRTFELALFRADDSTVAWQTGADVYFESLEGLSRATVRLEILLTILVQAALAMALELTLAGWACCYAAFAVNWSALQYADHAWSPLDVRDGAWDLRVNPLVRALFLNYHYHLAHHRHPKVPWIHLPRFVDPSRPRPAFLRIYLEMWRGPRVLPAPARATAPPGFPGPG